MRELMPPFGHVPVKTAIVITIIKSDSQIIKEWARETILDTNLPDSIKDFLFDVYQKIREER